MLELNLGNFLLILSITIGVDVILENNMIQHKRLKEAAEIKYRFLSISHITFYFFILDIVFDFEFFRGAILVYLPVGLPIFYYQIIFKMGKTQKRETIITAFVTHLIHAGICLYYFTTQKLCQWWITVIWGFLYSAYFCILWSILPGYKMIYDWGFQQTQFFLTVCCVFSTTILFLTR